MGKAGEAWGEAGRDESDPWQPLNGLTIVEVGEGVAVAFCGKMLADYGATVIKVEQPGSSDPVRAAGPDGLGGDGLIHLHINSNKRSVSLDLANEAEREELMELCRSADGVVGFFDRALLDLGVNPEALRAAADPLIVLALSWFGLTGPWRNFKCNDFLAQHASGLSFVTATRVADLERQPPLAAQGRLAEMVAGLTGATALLIALASQETESRGDTIDCAVVESLTAFLRGDTAPFTYGAGLLSRGKGAIGTIAPVALRETADGAVDFVIVRQSHWQALMELIGNPEWADLELFATPDLRRFHWDAIEPLLSESIAGFTSEYLFHEGQRRNVVCAPMNTVGQVLESDLINEREFVRTGDHPRHGPLRYPGLPFRVGEPRAVTPAPDPGEHTAEVLAGRLETRERPAAGVTSVEAHDLPLKGIRIGDFGWVIAGPFATLLLGRMGAEVIRVEGISPPDQFRELGPFVEGHKTLNSSGLFSVLNAGKSSVTFQLNDAEQARLAREVALSCDVLIENLGVGRLARFGLGYESLAAERPDLVMVSLTGFGLSGPLASYKAYVTNILAYVGMTASLGYEGGPGKPPGANLSDYTSGVTAAFAALCGLRYAREHGRGVHIDLSMAEATLALMGPLLMDCLTTGAVPERRGNTFGDSAPCGVYRCSGGDKWVAICISDDDEWAALVDAMGRPPWALDPAFATREGRAAQGAEIDAKLNAWTRAFESLPLVERLQQGGVPAVPASDPEDLVNNPQFRARGAIAPQDSDSIGPRLIPNLPWHFDSHPELDATIPPPPALGEHNREILSRLTTASDELIARLCEAADSTGFQLADTSG